MRTLQRQVDTFVKANGMECRPVYRLLDAVSELGEVTKEMLKAADYGSEPFVRTDAWDNEIGDVVFSLLCLANSTGVDVEKAVEKALQKYANRIAENGKPHSVHAKQ